VFVSEAGLAGVPVEYLPVRLGVLPGDVSAVIAAAGKPVLTSDQWLVWRSAAAQEAERLGALVAEYHRAHPLETGMSLQALRAVVETPAGRERIVDLVLDLAVRKMLLEVAGGVVRRPGWAPVFDARADGVKAALLERIARARWEIPTAAELEREWPGAPVRMLLAHLVREGGVEAVDQEHFATPAALAEFREALRAALGELGAASPADLRDRFGLTRKYLIPLLEWADRRGMTRRRDDGREWIA
jgi:selenocysteine-specific elongation factor